MTDKFFKVTTWVAADHGSHAILSVVHGMTETWKAQRVEEVLESDIPEPIDLSGPDTMDTPWEEPRQP